MPRGAKPQDMTGLRYGRLVVLSHAGSDAQQKALWLAQCDCGARCVVLGKRLRNGDRRSCGCVRRENTRTIGRANATHGMTLTPTYASWKCMVDRCTNPRVKGWAYWGGRGISVCERWRVFEQFLADMGERPVGKKMIDRIDNDGNYEPGNCRWVTAAESNRNKRPGGRRRKP